MVDVKIDVVKSFFFNINDVSVQIASDVLLEKDNG